MKRRVPRWLKGILSRWNWKSAVVSSVFRALLFFAANLSSGLPAAIAALKVEFIYRGLVAGWYGALTEQFARARAGRTTTVAALVVVPGIAHVIEFTVHWLAGTPSLGVSVAASVGVSVLTTAFNLSAMRRGALIVGPGGKTLREDLSTIGGMVAAFIRERGWPSARSI